MLRPVLCTHKKEYCTNGFLKIFSSHTNGHPAVVPMVTALNHVVADGRRAGGLNISSSILTNYRDGESQGCEGASLLPAPAFLERQRYASKKKNQYENALLYFLRSFGRKN